MKNEQLLELQTICAGHCLTDEPMCRHTTFRTGGPARAFAQPESEEELSGILTWCRENRTPFYIIGNGSNLLVSDDGFEGVVIQLFKNFSSITSRDGILTAQAGARLSVLAHTALENHLAGLAFASGIPGTVGGAVVMNAGAYGGEMKDVLTRVRILTQEGTIQWVNASELKLGYRTSRIPEEGWVVLAAEMKLTPGDADEIAAVMEDLKQQRILKQPLDLPSAGSTFKRPEGNFAGKLIMEAGLRGFRVGDAQVSEKHCGFVVNRGQASSADIWKLICEVRRKVFEDSGILLEPEVKLLGTFPEFG